MAIYGYARVSTDGQTVDAQISDLKQDGADKVFSETASGAKTDRAQLAKLIQALQSGDTLVVQGLIGWHVARVTCSISCTSLGSGALVSSRL